MINKFNKKILRHASMSKRQIIIIDKEIDFICSVSMSKRDILELFKKLENDNIYNFTHITRFGKWKIKY